VSGTVNIQTEELKMASLCVGYLSLPGFNSFLGDDSVRQLLQHGYYAFLDYASCYWVAHIKAGVASGMDKTSARSLANLLQSFLSTHHRNNRQLINIPEEIRQQFDCLGLQGTWSGFERFLEAWYATERQVQQFGDFATLNDVLDMPDVIARIRKFLEESKLDTNHVALDTFCRFYGSELFKCPRMSCEYFHLGFNTSDRRDDHVRKHKLPFGCSFPGCLRATLAFSSHRQLEKHIRLSHNPTNQMEHSYPSKRQKYSLECKSCGEYFYEPQKFSGHVCLRSVIHSQRDSAVDSQLGHPQSDTTPALSSGGKMPFSQEQFASMSPQQRLQVEAHMRRQQQSQIRGPIRNREAAEEAWNNHLPPKIMEAYNEISKNAPAAKPISVSADQRAIMTQQLQDSLDVLGRLDVLVLHGFGKMQGQERNVKNLLAMRIQLLRQFKPSQEWIVNDHFTITPDYLTGAILFIRKLFQVMIVRKNQGRPTHGDQDLGSVNQPGESSTARLDTSSPLDLQQEQDEAL
jgi:hypothetical protein